jgi:hypothetical protein
MRRPTMAHTVRPEKTFFFRSSTPSPPFDKKLIPSNCFPKKKNNCQLSLPGARNPVISKDIHGAWLGILKMILFPQIVLLQKQFLGSNYFREFQLLTPLEKG